MARKNKTTNKTRTKKKTKKNKRSRRLLGGAAAAPGVLYSPEAQSEAQAQAQAEAEVEIWTTEMKELSKSKTVVELRKMLRMKGMLVGGTKKELVKRLFS